MAQVHRLFTPSHSYHIYPVTRTMENSFYQGYTHKCGTVHKTKGDLPPLTAWVTVAVRLHVNWHTMANPLGIYFVGKL